MVKARDVVRVVPAGTFFEWARRPPLYVSRPFWLSGIATPANSLGLSVTCALSDVDMYLNICIYVIIYHVYGFLQHYLSTTDLHRSQHESSHCKS